MSAAQNQYGVRGVLEQAPDRGEVVGGDISISLVGAEGETALDVGCGSTKRLQPDTPFGRMSGPFGVRMGAAPRPWSPAPPHRPMRMAAKQPDPLVDVHLDGTSLIVTPARLAAQGVSA